MLTNGKAEVEAQLRQEAGSMGGLGQIAKLLQVQGSREKAAEARARRARARTHTQTDTEKRLMPHV